MTTVIQGEGGGNSGVTGAVVIVMLVVGVALGIAYMNGAFTGPAGPTTTVIENKTIEHKTVVVPITAPAPPAAPAAPAAPAK